MNDETLPQSYYFCIKNALKLTYEHLYFKKILGSLSLTMTESEKKERKGKGREGKGREQGKDKGLQPQKFGTLSTPLISPRVTQPARSID
jgi:hypothetical protein